MARCEVPLSGVYSLEIEIDSDNCLQLRTKRMTAALCLQDLARQLGRRPAEHPLAAKFTINNETACLTIGPVQPKTRQEPA